jgi:hypothetical protein
MCNNTLNSYTLRESGRDTILNHNVFSLQLLTIALPLETLVTIADCYTTTHYNPQQQQQLLIVVVVVVQQVVVGRMSDIVHLRELYMVQV